MPLEYTGKREFFRKATPAAKRRIAGEVRDVHPDISRHVDNILRQDSEIVFRLRNCLEEDPIIPEEHYEQAFGGPYRIDGPGGNASWHFLRHGPEAVMTRYDSARALETALEEFRQAPKENMPPYMATSRLSNVHYFMIDQSALAYGRAFDRNGAILSGLVWHPIQGNDKRTRKVALTELIEAAWLTVYSEQVSGLNINVEIPDHFPWGVLRDGGIIPVEGAPSRREKVSRYAFDLVSVPVAYNNRRHLIAYSVGNTLDNHPEKRNLQRQARGGSGRAAQRDPKVLHWVAEDIAAYWKMMRNFYDLPIEHLRRANKRRNIPQFYSRIVPLETCMFRMPNQETIDFYFQLMDRTIVLYHNNQGKVKERNLRMGEMEIYLSEYVNRHNYGIWDTFFLPAGQKIQSLNFTNRPINRK